MAKNNRKKAVAEAISIAVALGWVIMQVESAQAATLTVNNLNDSGVGSLRDTINIASNNDVVEFLLGNNPSTITLTSGALAMPAAGYAYAKNLTINGPGANLLTISGNNQFPVFDISGANVTFSGLAIAGNINAYNSSNVTFINSTISGDNVNIDSNLTLINSTISSERLAINGELTGINDSNVTALSSTTIGGNLTSSSGTLTISTGRLDINDGMNNSEAAGSITVTADSIVLISGSQVTTPISVVKGNSGQINAGSNDSGAGGNITITSGTLLLTTVPEPSAIAGTILAGSLAWLAKRKQVAFRKAKV
ncbi:PEP-CTERM sorting domain-containing protein [Nostoc sp.]|uniref:PEP-CTERM sorting domain-containing protein n=1 Tax=Nostoc sp. TaxID=1180 RepID=UPI002FF4AF3A